MELYLRYQRIDNGGQRYDMPIKEWELSAWYYASIILTLTLLSFTWWICSHFLSTDRWIVWYCKWPLFCCFWQRKVPMKDWKRKWTVCRPWIAGTALCPERTASGIGWRSFRVAHRKRQPHDEDCSPEYESPLCRKRELPYPRCKLLKRKTDDKYWHKTQYLSSVLGWNCSRKKAAGLL